MNEKIEKLIQQHKRTVNHYAGVLHRNIQRSLFWEGKFHQVKRENNKLRKKLYPNK